MKNLLVTLAMVFLGTTAALAQNSYEVTYKDLPKDIQKYVTKNFEGFAVDKAVQEQDKDGKVSYTDVFVSKASQKYKLIFDRKDNFVKKEAVHADEHKSADSTKKQ